MQGGMEQDLPPRQRISDLRRICDQEIRAHRQKAEDAAAAFRLALFASKTKAEENIADREKLGKAKLYFKELEDALRETLIVKSCREAKQASTTLSLTSAKAKTEDLRKAVEKQLLRKSEYESVISLAIEELSQDTSKDDMEAESTKEAISWYRKVLGFQTEGGEGVKFIFDKIHSEDPDKEYSFTIQLIGDTYSLLQCDPSVSDAEMLLDELNRTNGLFKFVREMRKKFLSVTENELSRVSASSPLASIDESRSEVPGSQKSPRSKRPKSPKESEKRSSSRSGQLKSLEVLRRSPRQKVNQLH